jgi:flagellar P-ring protein precursor FlgI
MKKMFGTRIIIQRSSDSMLTISKPLLGIFFFAVLYSLSFPLSSKAARIKDMANIKGVRNNQLVGYGLVVGLDGTGDGKKSKFTTQSMVSMLEQMGVSVGEKDVTLSNVAAVMVTADLPPFTRSGSRIDALVSSIGDASNLQGGTLLLTPLKAVNGKIYAVAQGPVVTGGFLTGGAGGSVQKNFPTAGRILNGAIVEKEVENTFNNKRFLTFSLNQPDFTTATRVAEIINSQFYDNIAHTPDAGTIKVRVPERFLGNIVGLVAFLERLDVTPDIMAKVVINERTGTVVMGENVKISTLAIAHGNLSIVIRESLNVSQPLPFSEGETVATPNTEVAVEEGQNKLMVLESGVSIRDLVKALNALGVSPRDLVAIFQAIKAAGALQAELEII